MGSVPEWARLAGRRSPTASSDSVVPLRAAYHSVFVGVSQRKF